VTELAFLSPDQSGPEVRMASPLARALPGVAADAAVREGAPLGTIELRGPRDSVQLAGGERLVAITPQRGLVLVDGSPAAALSRLRAAGVRAYDLTGALTALEVDGEALLRRLTDLDLDRLPAAAPVARGVPAIVERADAGTFRLLVPQELAHYVAETALDLAKGVAR
jgi:sarcosine oxidase gamma subunit